MILIERPEGVPPHAVSCSLVCDHGRYQATVTALDRCRRRRKWTVSSSDAFEALRQAGERALPALTKPSKIDLASAIAHCQQQLLWTTGKKPVAAIRLVNQDT